MIRKVTKCWKTRDGTKIRICDMTDAHLLNTIAMIRRVTKKKRDALLSSAYNCSRLIQGEMAEMDLDNAIDSMEGDPDGESFLPDIFDYMLLDVKRRGLKAMT